MEEKQKCGHKDVLVAEDEETQLYNLLPISKLFPANEILPKQYSSDLTPKEELNQKRKSTKQRQIKIIAYSHRKILLGLHMKGPQYKIEPMESEVKYLGGLFVDEKVIERAKTSFHNIFYQVGKSKVAVKEADVKFSTNKCSSNLLYVFQKKQNQFDLIVHNDTNSKGSTQWFNFDVSFEKKSVYKFNIVNLTKRKSLFSKGMTVLFYSSKYNKWRRNQSQTSYFQNQIPIEDRNQEVFYKTASFYYRSSQKEKVIFSYGYPYTLEDSQEYWKNIYRNLAKRTKPKIGLQTLIVGETISGLKIESFVIREAEVDSKSSLNMKNIVFLGRQHSGQTQGSFIIEGIVDFLINSANLAVSKKSFIFHFIPIINMEGVLYGNYRTNLKGYDLNRNWRFPDRENQPQIYYIRKYLHRINEEAPIALIMDLHGHSKCLNSFFYGVGKMTKENSKILPYFLSKKMKQISFVQSNFNVSEDKKNTARVVLSELFPKALVYTLQNSFYGYKLKDKIIDYSPSALRKFGKDLIMGILQYYSQTQAGLKSIEYKRQLQKQLDKYERIAVQMGRESAESDSQAEDQLLYQEKIQRQKSVVEKEVKKIIIRREKHSRNKYLSRRLSHTKRERKIDYINKEGANKENGEVMLSETIIHYLSPKSNRKQKKETMIPLLSVNIMRPVSRQYVYNRISSARKKSMNGSKTSRLSNLNGVQFVNEKEKTLQEIKKRKVMKEEAERKINVDMMRSCIIPLEIKKEK